MVFTEGFTLMLQKKYQLENKKTGRYIKSTDFIEAYTICLANKKIVNQKREEETFEIYQYWSNKFHLNTPLII